ncbi:MAG: hypothetical protein IJ666_01300 [Ruminococcus sp.]|nr:hypothetical protein [Ruminococcus sp.]
MNKHTKLVVSLLFAVMIVLAAAITRFYFDTPNDRVNKKSQVEIVRRLDVDSSGNRVFEDSSRNYGIADSSDRIIAAPEWLSLEFAGQNFCIASRRIGGKKLCGCIDYEGNITVPFIYESIKKKYCGDVVFYAAYTASGSECVIYDDVFIPVFRHSWVSCDVKGNEVILKSNVGDYTFSAGDGGFIFKGASVRGSSMDCDYSFDVYSRIILSKLDAPMLEKICGDIGEYLEFAYTGNDDILSDITTGSRSSFYQLFQDDHKVLSKKLLGISDIYIYSKKSDNGVPVYSVSLQTDTEITYTDETGTEKTLRDNYKASIDFSGSSESNLTAASGKFALSEPDYPSPEFPSETEETENNLRSIRRIVG